MKDLRKLKIAYSPYDNFKDYPGDRRRFLFYTNTRNINYEIYNPSKNYDLVFLSEASDIGIAEKLYKTETKVIRECINSYYLEHNNSKDIFRGLAKFLTGRSKKLYLNYSKSLRKLIRQVDAVTCASKEQANQLSSFAKNIHIIPDVFNNEQINMKEDYSIGNTINIAWEGLGSNAYQLNYLNKVLEKFSKKNKFILHIITDKYHFKHMNKFGKISTLETINKISAPIKFHEWDKTTYSKILTECDIAIIPININSQIALGKPENKLIHFWKMGIPTLTYATSSYDRVMKDAEINLSCKTDDDWIEKLGQLSADSILREKLASKAKSYAEKYYSEQAVLEIWDLLFRSILQD